MKVLVLNYDPQVPGRQGTRLHTVCNWKDPHQLAQDYASDVAKASGGLVRYNISSWRDIDEIPTKEDGFCYTTESYLACFGSGKGWHRPDKLNYRKMLTDNRIVDAINSEQVDEVWLFGGP